jgi:PKHD-type hydroxylase
MILHVPNVLTGEQVARCRETIMQSKWVDGRITAGQQSALVKNNLQLPEESSEARELGDMILGALECHPLFISAALPCRVFPPIFNRYDVGMSLGTHVDNSIRPVMGRRFAFAPISRPRSS